MEKALLTLIKINLKLLKTFHASSSKELLGMILSNTTFNVFRKEFSFELSNELRKKYGGFSFKKKQNTILTKEKMMKFNEEPLKSSNDLEPRPLKS